jgi:hypothetical protein
MSAIPTLKWLVPVQRFRVAAQHHDADDCNSHSDQNHPVWLEQLPTIWIFNSRNPVPAFSHPPRDERRTTDPEGL